MTYPTNHKLVLMLDKRTRMLKSSECAVDIEAASKQRSNVGPSIIPMAPLYKTLWTCNVEASVEFCRVVFDLFPNKKLVSCKKIFVQRKPFYLITSLG